MSKQARATAQAQRTSEGAPSPARVSLRTYAGGSLPASNEHAVGQRDKPLSLRDLQRWPELSIVPPLTSRPLRSGQPGPAPNSAPPLKSPATKPPAAKNAGAGKPSIGHDFSRVRVHATPAPALQTKLAVNQPGDQYEQEADQVADNVLRMAAPGTTMAPATPNDDTDKPEDGNLLRKERNGAAPQSAADAPPIVSEVLRGSGQPLDGATRSFMEQRLGHDFSHVRIHTGEQASGSARAVNALAYTVGRDVVFERDQYAPETDAGRRLLAHELTHVVQQREASALPASPSMPGAALVQPVEPVTVRKDQLEQKGPWDDPVDFAARSSEQALVVSNLHDNDGQPLDKATRSFMERRFRYDFSSVRIHADTHAAEVAQVLNAWAYTLGQDIYFNRGRYQPGTTQGKQLLAHELTHTIQQSLGRPYRQSLSHPDHAVSQHHDAEEQEARMVAEQVVAGQSLPIALLSKDLVCKSLIQRDGPSPPPGYTFGSDPDHPLVAQAIADEPDLDLSLTPIQKRDFSFKVVESDPALFVVPADATREDIAARLMGDEKQTNEFEFVIVDTALTIDNVRGQAIRVRDASLLVPDAMNALRAALDKQLAEDVDWTINKLKERFIDDAEELALVERALRWSQRSDIKSATGVQYFDRYLDELGSVIIKHEGLFSDTSKTALEWLLDETEEKAERIRKAMELRSSHSTGYQLYPDTRPQFSPGNVIGRFAYSNGSTVQLQVVRVLVDETTLDRAETATRNASFTGLRAIVPGGNNHFYGYALQPNLVNDPLVKRPEDDPGGHYYWYYPGTIDIQANEFRPDFPHGGAPEKEQRQQLLNSALTKATSDDPSPIYGLDYDTLSLATIDQRIAIMNLILDSSDVQALDSHVLERTILATSNQDFPVLERRMSTGGLIAKLFNMDPSSGVLASVGRVFTIKALASTPIGVKALTEMETFELGEDASGRFLYAWSGTEQVKSQLIAPGQWDPQAAARIGTEPGLPGESAGPFNRTAIVFYRASIKGGIKQLLTHPSEVAGPSTKSRQFLPTELVRIEALGPQPQTIIVTALEAAGILTLPFEEYVKRVISPAININLIAMMSAGLVRAFGSALVEGLLAGGLRGGLAAVASQAATQAGRQALKSFFFDAVLLGSMQVVDAYRDELQKSEAGRLFLATYDIAMGILVARDVYRLLSSGVMAELASRGALALRAVGSVAKTGFRRVIEEYEAFVLAWNRLRSARELVEVVATDGTRVLQPRDEGTFQQFFMSARAEVASKNVLATLSEAGESTAIAERVFDRLQKLSESSGEFARAHTAIARRAADMAPATANTYLSTVERILNMRPRGAVELSGFLFASAGATDPIAFLADVETLVARKGIGLEALGVLGTKTAKRKLNLAWLNSTGLSDTDLDFLGRDPNTPWDAYQQAALASAEDMRKLGWAQGALRGAASEILAKDKARELFDGFRISDRQVKMGDSIIDFEITSTDGRAARHGLEVKGWTPKRWRDALNAYRLRSIGAAYDKGAADMIDRLLKQLMDVRNATRRAPYLAVTDGLSEPTRRMLEDLLSAEARGTEIVPISESQIKAKARQLAEGLNIGNVGED